MSFASSVTKWGLGTTIAALLPLGMTFVTVFGICSGTEVAEVVVPFAIIAQPLQQGIPFLLIFLFQFPAYGIVLGAVSWRFPGNWFALTLTFLLLAGIHVAAVIVARKAGIAAFNEMLNGYSTH